MKWFKLFNDAQTTTTTQRAIYVRWWWRRCTTNGTKTTAILKRKALNFGGKARVFCTDYDDRFSQRWEIFFFLIVLKKKRQHIFFQSQFELTTNGETQKYAQIKMHRVSFWGANTHTHTVKNSSGKLRDDARACVCEKLWGSFSVVVVKVLTFQLLYRPFL